jgi:hypothetical protein
MGLIDNFDRNRQIIIIFIIITFLAGMYFCTKTGSHFTEGMTSNLDVKRCPDTLIQKGTKFYLYTSSVAKVPGVNPIEFQNLEEYVEFMDWQRSQGIRCPVLYLQRTFDAQGSSVYKIRPDVNDLQGGLPPSLPNPTQLVDATRNDQPYNTNSVPAYDQTSYYVGTNTPLDNIQSQSQENLLYSPDPMDDNWGGVEYTNNLVDTGYFAGNEVSIRVN